MGPYVALCTVAVGALLVAGYSESRVGVWISKPLASSAFLGAALAGGALDSQYGRWILVGLALSWLGDVLLIPRNAPRVFQAGVLSFLLGHVAYTGGFATLGIASTPALAAAVVAVVAGAAIFRSLDPHIPAEMRVAAYAYMVVISLMVIAAAGAAFTAATAAILVGAVAFYLSDISVARDRFVGAAFANRLWGLPLYYAAQLVLASTVAR